MVAGVVEGTLIVITVEETLIITVVEILTVIAGEEILINAYLKLVAQTDSYSLVEASIQIKVVVNLKILVVQTKVMAGQID